MASNLSIQAAEQLAETTYAVYILFRVLRLYFDTVSSSCREGPALAGVFMNLTYDKHSLLWCRA